MRQDAGQNIQSEIQHLFNEEMGIVQLEPDEDDLDEEEEDFFENAKINFWACHTNFNIDKKTFNVIKNTEGIEFIQVKTRYCFLIAVGKLFHFNDVRKSIEKELQCTSEVNSTIESLKDLAKYWVCLVKQNGDIEYSASENDDSFDMVYKDLEFFQAYVKRNGGRLILSESLEDEKENNEDDDKFKSDI